MKYMLDTNICIYAIKHNPQKVIEHLREHAPSDMCISSITYAELCHGVEKSQNKIRNKIALTVLLANIKIEPFDASSAENYGLVKAKLEKAGTPIGPLDTMIAGHAMSMGCTVVTNNTKDFSRVDGLIIEDWTI